MPRTVGTRKKRRSETGKSAGKRYPLNMRTTKTVRDRLEGAALLNGRSLAQEVEDRLEKSFDTDDRLGGPLSARLFDMLGATIAEAYRQTGHNWLEHQPTFSLVQVSIYSILGRLEGDKDKAREYLRLNKKAMSLGAMRALAKYAVMSNDEVAAVFSPSPTGG